MEAPAKTRTFTIQVEKGEHEYVAQCIEYPACITQGTTVSEAVEEMREAIAAYLEAVEPNSGDIDSENWTFQLAA